jgi:ATP-binding cassette, subfamily C (CFTR/MRP), member 1
MAQSHRFQIDTESSSFQDHPISSDNNNDRPRTSVSSFFQTIKSALPVFGSSLNNKRDISGHVFQRLGDDDDNYYFDNSDAIVEDATLHHHHHQQQQPHTSAFRPAGHWCPEESSGLGNKIAFNFVNTLISLGYNRTLEQEDLWDVSNIDSAAAVSETFQWQLNSASGNLSKAIIATHKRLFILAGVIKLMHDIVMFTSPLILEQVLNHLQHQEDGGRSGWTGMGLVLALAAASLLETVSVNIYFHILFRISMHLKVGLADALFRKSLKISAGARARLGTGTIVNLQSNDASKLWSIPQYLHMIWSAPFQILVVMAMLVRVITPLPALAGLAVTLLLIPASTMVGKKLARIRKNVVQCTDIRVKACTEIILGIKAIKLYAWEEAYKQRILDLRAKELKEIKLSSLLSTLNNMVFGGGPILISMAAFLTYGMLGHPLTAAVAFPALSLFNLLRFPVMMLPSQITTLINGKVALDRLQNFLDADETRAPIFRSRSSTASLLSSEVAVQIKNGTYAWDTDAGSDPILHDIQLQVHSGKLVIVVGSVGAGKSSLLSALLQEMVPLRGDTETTITGSVSYCQQEPWIQNDTIKGNILMGSTFFDADRYNAAIQAAALPPDLASLPAGDATEIGEKGVNLSGGQRHRVALARAAYAGADVVLLDDPLSAVDAHVGRHLFEKCIKGVMAGSTRILVTHQLQYLPAADQVVILNEGRIVDRGSYSELVGRGVDFHQFEIESNEGEAEGEGSDDGMCDGKGEEKHTERGRGADNGENMPVSLDDSAREDISKNPTTTRGSSRRTTDTNNNNNNNVDTGRKKKEGDNLLIELDDLQEVSLLDDYNNKYQQDVCVAAETGGATVVNGTNAHIHGDKKEKSNTVADGMDDNGKLTVKEERAVGRVDKRVYRRYFASWGPAFWVPTLVIALAAGERGLQSGQHFWLSIWSTATEKVQLIEPGGEVSHVYMWTYFLLGLVSLVLQAGKAVVVVLGSITAAKRLHASLLDTVLGLPMSFFDSQPTGRLLNRFTKDTEAVDVQLSSSVNSFLNCAVSVLWSLIVIILVSPGVLLALIPLSLSYAWIQSRYISTSRELKRLDSLALSPIFGIFGETLSGLATVRAFKKQDAFLLRNAHLLNESNRAWWPAQCVNRWLSVRLELLGTGVVFGTAIFVVALMPASSAGLAGLALTSALNLTGLLNWGVRMTTELEVNMNSTERMMEYEVQQTEAPAVIPERRPLPGWPSQGAIQVDHLVVKYRPSLPPVLKDVSFSIKPMEKIGIVGRTGSGKSTLMLALYRIIEPTSGRIIIDGIDVASIGLADLRSRLALVPQDPVIFSGTVRSNLDPFEEHTAASGGDSKIWDALERAGLADTVRSFPLGLSAKIEEGGSNLSVGQRQLLCMARALLRSAKVLVLDEATSNVDTASDALIQKTIATSFSDRTVLTIAHRLHTIMDSDRVLVLARGEVAEFDSPLALMKKQRGGIFRGLVEETQSSSSS